MSITLVACALCGSTALVPFAEAPVGTETLHHAQVRCAACGLVAAQPQADDEAMRAYYDGAYYGEQWTDAAALHHENRQWHLTDGLPRLEALWAPFGLGPPGDAVEIGCGYGGLLAALQSRGWRVRGTEPSAKASAYCASLGLDVLTGFGAAGLPNESADLTVAWHVLEHVRDPVAFVRMLVARVRPGGVVAIGTDAIWIAQYVVERAWARVRGRRAPYRTSTDHTFVFSPRHLERLLRDAGCDAVRVDSYSEPPPHESLHWKLYKGSCRSIDRLFGVGEFLLAAGRRGAR